jgi:kumamolisin
MSSSSSKGYVPISSSQRKVMRGAKAVGAADSSEQIQVTVRLRPRNAIAQTERTLSARAPSQREYLSRADFAANHGATADDIRAVENFAHQNQLTVVRASVPERSVKLTGTVGQFSQAFGVKLKKYRSKTATYRGREGAVQVPRELSAIIEGVFGLDNRPVAKPHIRFFRQAKGQIRSHTAGDGGFDPRAIAELYNFPLNATGQGQTIALIELTGQKGASGYEKSDLDQFFKKQKKSPQVISVGVDGGSNRPGIDTDADGEVTLDIEVAGAIAPNASIVVYFSKNTDAGFLDAVLAAIHDTVHKPSIISISWGGPEDSWTEQSLNAFENAFTDAAALGITICIAAGDDGSSDNENDGKAHCDFPASAPHALACGRTQLTASKGKIISEIAWNNDDSSNGAGGGGVSDVFPLPSYQTGVSVPQSLNGKKGRGVPDVAGDASPLSGYHIILQGRTQSIGGTSAVAPLMAGLIALCNEKSSKPAGFINPILYRAGGGTLRDITQGNNDVDGTLGGYDASSGWDACTGLGVPDGRLVLLALSGQSALVNAGPSGVEATEREKVRQ